MLWFIKEQVEEVSSMSDLLRVVERARENPLLAEEYLVREATGEAADATAPGGGRRRALSGVPEAPLAETAGGLEPAGEGWFVVNAARRRLVGASTHSARAAASSPARVRFPQIGDHAARARAGQAELHVPRRGASRRTSSSCRASACS